MRHGPVPQHTTAAGCGGINGGCRSPTRGRHTWLRSCDLRRRRETLSRAGPDTRRLRSRRSQTSQGAFCAAFRDRPASRQSARHDRESYSGWATEDGARVGECTSERKRFSVQPTAELAVASRLGALRGLAARSLVASAAAGLAAMAGRVSRSRPGDRCHPPTAHASARASCRPEAGLVRPSATR